MLKSTTTTRRAHSQRHLQPSLPSLLTSSCVAHHTLIIWRCSSFTVASSCILALAVARVNKTRACAPSHVTDRRSLCAIHEKLTRIESSRVEAEVAVGHREWRARARAEARGRACDKRRRRQKCANDRSAAKRAEVMASAWRVAAAAAAGRRVIVATHFRAQPSGVDLRRAATASTSVPTRTIDTAAAAQSQRTRAQVADTPPTSCRPPPSSRSSAFAASRSSRRRRRRRVRAARRRVLTCERGDARPPPLLQSTQKRRWSSTPRAATRRRPSACSP